MREEFMRMHGHKSVSIADNMVKNLRINDIITHPLTFVGTLKADGTGANPGYYTDPYGEFSDVGVHGFVTIRLEERYNLVN
jgi:hypothetical protein